VEPSGVWRDRLDKVLLPDRDTLAEAPPSDPVLAAAQAGTPTRRWPGLARDDRSAPGRAAVAALPGRRR
jgi:hypothetical protein